MWSLLRGTCLVWVAATLMFAQSPREKPRGPERWAEAIATFERSDAENPPPEGAVLFVGSSSIRMWDLKKSFPQLDAINRGFGGSQIVDSTHYADVLILKHRPRLVVLYAGDNDIASGKSAETVARDFDAFVAKVHAGLPRAHIVFIAIKPSLKRWSLYDKIREANRLIASRCAKDERLEFIDVAQPMLGEDGRPRKELFVKDRLHLSEAGYRVWTDALGPLLENRKAF
ncbi:MAG: hypothetical protein KY476_21085 [Planctomycetes bacterium]|nr:hypothetical protein [Planctomycetota bacterium]